MAIQTDLLLIYCLNVRVAGTVAGPDIKWKVILAWWKVIVIDYLASHIQDIKPSLSWIFRHGLRGPSGLNPKLDPSLKAIISQSVFQFEGFQHNCKRTSRWSQIRKSLLMDVTNRPGFWIILVIPAVTLGQITGSKAENYLSGTVKTDLMRALPLRSAIPVDSSLHTWHSVQYGHFVHPLLPAS